MKKELVHELREIASGLPERWETTMIVTKLSGKDAALTCVGKSPYNPEKEYQFETPVFLRVNHVSRMKDGIKLHGQNFINTYIKHVVNG